MKRIVLLDSSYPINSRNLRIIEYLKKHHKIKIITWDRIMTSEIYDKDYLVFKKNAPYGNKLKKIKYFYSYYKFIKSFFQSTDVDYVIASNWDMLAIASRLKKKYDFNLIYENRDMVSSKNPTLKRCLMILEKYAISNSDSMIVASRYFVDFYKNYNKPIITVENKIPKNLTSYNKINSDNLRISFIGSVRFYQILVNLINAIRNLNVEVDIYGEGPAESRIQNYITKNNIDNVKLHGVFQYRDIGKLYSKTDVVWSVYPNSSSSNKKYVIPNKFFESIYFKTVGIFPENTKTGEMVSNSNIGYVVNPYSVEEILNTITFILNNKEDLEKKIVNINYSKLDIFWEDEIIKINEILK